LDDSCELRRNLAGNIAEQFDNAGTTYEWTASFGGISENLNGRNEGDNRRA
jgi:hypothetical protein